MKVPIILICKRVLFYSSIDEDLFFEWISRIPVITEVKGISDEIHLHVLNESLKYEHLNEIVALFDRYKIDMQQLSVFMNDDNRHWLAEFLKQDE